jgi:hypothetical protein
MTSSTLTLIKTTFFEKNDVKKDDWIRDQLDNSKTLMQCEQELLDLAKKYDTYIQIKIKGWIADFRFGLESSCKSVDSLKPLWVSLATNPVIYSRKTAKLKEKHTTISRDNFTKAIINGIVSLFLLLPPLSLLSLPLAAFTWPFPFALFILTAILLGACAVINITCSIYSIWDSWKIMRRKDWSIIDKMNKYTNIISVEIIPSILKKINEMDPINVVTAVDAKNQVEGPIDLPAPSVSNPEPGPTLPIQASNGNTMACRM